LNLEPTWLMYYPQVKPEDWGDYLKIQDKALSLHMIKSYHIQN